MKSIPKGSAMSAAMETAVQSRTIADVRNLSEVGNCNDLNDSNNEKTGDSKCTTAGTMSTSHGGQNLRNSAKDMIDAVITTSLTMAVKISSKGLSNDIPVQVVTTEEVGATAPVSPRGGVDATIN